MATPRSADVGQSRRIRILGVMIALILVLIMVLLRLCGPGVCHREPSPPQAVESGADRPVAAPEPNTAPAVPISVPRQQTPAQTHQQIRDAVKAQVKEEMKSRPEADAKSKSSGRGDFDDEPVGNVPSL